MLSLVAGRLAAIAGIPLSMARLGRGVIVLPLPLHRPDKLDVRLAVNKWRQTSHAGDRTNHADNRPTEQEESSRAELALIPWAKERLQLQLQQWSRRMTVHWGLLQR